MLFDLCAIVLIFIFCQNEFSSLQKLGQLLVSSVLRARFLYGFCTLSSLQCCVSISIGFLLCWPCLRRIVLWRGYYPQTALQFISFTLLYIYIVYSESTHNETPSLPYPPPPHHAQLIFLHLL